MEDSISRKLRLAHEKYLKGFLESDPEKMAETFDLLRGDNLQGRKEFIAENGKLYIDMTDVS